jgi:hypothetical protein
VQDIVIKCGLCQHIIADLRRHGYKQ